jgi:adenylyl-sulfate kinase
MDHKQVAQNITWHHSQVTRAQREGILNQRGTTIWFTGLPASGKSTTAFATEYALVDRGILTYVLDGDNVRHGLNKDLGFSAEERVQNIRRVAEAAKLLADAGLIVITSLISPFRNERDFARRLHEENGLRFIEVFVDTPLEVCEARDPKKLYAKARRGELKGYTGVDDPYEPPDSPELTVRTTEDTPEEIAEQIIDYLCATKVAVLRA